MSWLRTTKGVQLDSARGVQLCAVPTTNLAFAQCVQRQRGFWHSIY